MTAQELGQMGDEELYRMCRNAEGFRPCGACLGSGIWQGHGVTAPCIPCGGTGNDTLGKLTYEYAAELRKSLSEEERSAYADHLEAQMDWNYWSGLVWLLADASPRAHAIAFLLTKGASHE